METIWAHNLRELFQPNKTVEINAIQLEKKRWVIEGTMDGCDCSFPATPQQVISILQEIAENKNDIAKQQNQQRKLANKTKAHSEKSDIHNKAQAELPIANTKDTPRRRPLQKGPAFSPPTNIIKKTKRKRLGAEGAALYKKFVNTQPTKSKRRTLTELNDVYIAKSYLLDEQTDTVLKWIKHFDSIKKGNGKDTPIYAVGG